MKQRLCKGCRRIVFGDHDCMAPPASLPAAAAKTNTWIASVRRVCNSSCEHWIASREGRGCGILAKPCNVFVNVRAGKACPAGKYGERPRDGIHFPRFVHQCRGGERAICTVCTGRDAWRMATITLPRMKAYAERCDAELIVVTEDRFPQWPIGNKFVARSVARKFDRTLFVDIDAFIRPHTPNAFETFPPGAIYIHEDFDFLIPGYVDFLGVDAEILGIDKEPLRARNTGFVLFDRDHADIWKPPQGVKNLTHTLEQTSVEWRSLTSGFPVRNIPSEWNTQYWWRQNYWDRRDDAFVVHLAGTNFPRRMAELSRLDNEANRNRSDTPNRIKPADVLAGTAQ